MSFTDILARYTPPFLLKPWGRKWVDAVGGELDKLVDRTYAAVLSRMPKRAPDDALDVIGWERMLPRMPGETLASYSLRLWSAWWTWLWSGTSYGIMLAFEAMGWTIAHVDKLPFCSLKDASCQFKDTRFWSTSGPGASIEKRDDGGPAGLQRYMRVHNTGLGLAKQYALEPGWTLWRLKGWIRSDGATVPEAYFWHQLIWQGATVPGWQWIDVIASSNVGAGSITDFYIGGTSGGSGYVDVAGLTLEPVGLAEAAYWPGAWPMDAEGTTTQVWIVNQADWAPPAGWETYWSAFWAALDYHSHVSDYEWVGFTCTGRLGGGTSKAIIQHKASSVIQRSLEPTMTSRDEAALCTLGEVLVLFGGKDGAGTKLSDTWLFWHRSGKWVRALPTTSPSARFGHTMVEYQGKVILAFGYDVAGRCQDTWAFDNGEWTALAPATPPQRRYHSAAAVFDDLLILYAGDAAGLTHYETLAYNGVDWNLLAPAHHPKDLYGHSMTALADGILLFGGYADDAVSPVNETWLWNGTDWVQLNPAHSPPARYFHAAMRIGDNQVLIVGGTDGAAKSDAWLWDGVDWTAVTAFPATIEKTGYVSLHRKVACQYWDGGWAWDDGSTWSTALTEDEVDLMKTSIRKWKGSHATCPEMVLVPAEGGWDGIWGGDGAIFWRWDDGTTWGVEPTVRIPVGEE
jgi:hypothetical protein